jgi:poly [ADP-ribose] polymerase
MAPTTRGKRPAADVEPSPVPTKQPRKTRATKAKPEPNEDADETLADEVKKPAPRKARGKAGVKSETVEDEEVDVVDPPKAKAAPKKGAKAKADVGPTQSDEQADAAEPDEPKAKKGRGKAKVKEEVAEDEDDKDVKETKAAPATEVKEAQVAKAGTSQIPLDEGCYLTNYHVYVDPNDSLIYDAALNQTNASGNNNKFYRVQVSTNGTTSQ